VRFAVTMNFPFMRNLYFRFGARRVPPGIAGVIAGLVLFFSGCGNAYRPVEYPIAPATGNPKLARFAIVVFQAEDPSQPGFCIDGTIAPCIGATSQLDVSGDSVVANVYVGHTPVQAALSSLVAVSNHWDDSVSLFGLTTGTPSAGGTIPSAVSLPAGSGPTAMVAANGAVYVADHGSNQVSVVSPASSAILPNICLDSSSPCTASFHPVALAATPDGTKVYVANSDNSVTVISTVDNTMSTRLTNVTAAQPVAIVADSSGDSIYVLENVTPSFSVIDVLTDTTVVSTTACLQTPPQLSQALPCSGGSNFMAFDPNLHRLYVTNPGNNSVSVFDASALSSLATPKPPTLLALVTSQMNGACAVAPLPDGSRAYVVLGGTTTGCNGSSSAGQVAVINANSNTVSGTIAVGNGPITVAASGDGSRVYVPHQGQGSFVSNGSTVTVATGVTVIDATTNQLVLEIGSPFTSTSCQTDYDCPGFKFGAGASPPVAGRMFPVFIVSQ